LLWRLLQRVKPEAMARTLRLSLILWISRKAFKPTEWPLLQTRCLCRGQRFRRERSDPLLFALRPIREKTDSQSELQNVTDEAPKPECHRHGLHMHTVHTHTKHVQHKITTNTRTCIHTRRHTHTHTHSHNTHTHNTNMYNGLLLIKQPID